MISHPSLSDWEARLDKAIDELDHILEEKYGGSYKLHPVRRKRGTTIDPTHDGLFSIAAQFSLGIGSELGRGYIVDLKMVTLQDVKDSVRDEIEDFALGKLNEILPNYFATKNLGVVKDGNVIKITGDLSLGPV
jgi:hypothetical protein